MGNDEKLKAALAFLSGRMEYETMGQDDFLALGYDPPWPVHWPKPCRDQVEMRCEVIVFEALTGRAY